jgi:hypothetical protein
VQTAVKIVENIEKTVIKPGNTKNRGKSVISRLIHTMAKNPP